MIDIKNVCKSFGDVQVLKNINLHIYPGEVVAIIGPSGSGKSTLLRCITMLEKVDSGTINVQGETMVDTVNGRAVYSPKSVLQSIRRKIGLVFQQFNLFPHYSVLKNVTDAQIHIARRSKEEAKAIAMELLEKMDLSDKADAYPQQLSGGQSQRVAIARALAMSPDILFFDEPTSALDPQLTEEVMRVIRMLAESKTTMAVVTHEMGFARDVADRIIFMADGQVIADGTPDEILVNPTNERIKAFLGYYK